MGLVDITKSDPLEHPYEPGVTISVRALLGTEMDEAEEVKQKRIVLVWGDSLDIITKLTASSKGKEQDNLALRLQSYDVSTLLKYAITAWTYEVEATLENILKLDALTRQWLAEEVVKRNTRPLGKGKSGEGSLSLAESPSS